jgi:hypothetical protein
MITTLATSQNPSKKPWFKVPVAGGPIPGHLFCLFFVTQWAEEIRAEMAISHSIISLLNQEHPTNGWKNPKNSNNGRRERREETNQSDEINI